MKIFTRIMTRSRIVRTRIGSGGYGTLQRLVVWTKCIAVHPASWTSLPSPSNTGRASDHLHLCTLLLEYPQYPYVTCVAALANSTCPALLMSLLRVCSRTRPCAAASWLAFLSCLLPARASTGGTHNLGTVTEQHPCSSNISSSSSRSSRVQPVPPWW
jgi:hypothetical protein